MLHFPSAINGSRVSQQALAREREVEEALRDVVESSLVE